MGVADLLRPHRLHALGEPGQLCPHGQRVPDRVRVHVAVEANPVGGGVIPLVRVAFVLLELSRVLGELKLQAVDGAAQAGQENAQVDGFRLRLNHMESLRKNVRKRKRQTSKFIFKSA